MSTDSGSSLLSLEIILKHIAAITLQSQRCQSLERFLQWVVDEARTLLQTDHVLIHRFLADQSAVVAFESVGAGCTPLLGQCLDAPYLAATWIERYQQGEIPALGDTHEPALDPCAVQPLARLQVQANLVVSLCSEEAQWGFLMAHHCRSPRAWTTAVVQLLQHMALQLGITMPYVAQQQRQRDRLERLTASHASHSSEPAMVPVSASSARDAGAATLRASEVKYDHLVEYLNVGFIVHAPNTQIVQCNAKACELLGLSKEQLLGKATLDPSWQFSREDGSVMPLEDYPVQRVLATQAPLHDYVVGIKRGDQSQRWVSVTAFPEWHRDGQLVQVIVTLLDISHLKQAEAKVRQLSEAMASAVSGIAFLDPQGCYVYANQAYASVTGYQPEDMVGMAWQQTVHPEDLAAVVGEYHRMQQSGRVELEARGLRQDGGIFYKQLVMVASYDDQQQFAGHYCFMKDISARKRLEQREHQQVAQERVLHQISQQLHQAQTLQTVLDTSVVAVQQCLGADRVVVYQFAANMHGQVVAEAVQPGWTPSLHVELEDNCFRENLGGDYQRGKTRAVSNIQDAGLSACHRAMLERFQVQANLVVPLLLPEPADAPDTGAPTAPLPRLWGLLVAHQCATTRQWQPSETALLEQVAVHMGIALQQAELLQDLQQLNETLEEQVQQRTEALQQQIRFESLLKQITDQVRDSLDEAQILQVAVTALGQGLAVDSCNTGLYDLEAWQFTVDYEYAPALPSVVGQAASLDYPSGVRAQLLTGQTLQFCWYGGRDPLRDLVCAHTILACPLQDERGVFGDLWLFRAHGEAFSEPEVRLVQQVANQCAIAVRQARLYADSQQQVQALEQLDRLKDDFLSTVSHELRTPLTSIKLTIHLLERHFQQWQTALLESSSTLALEVDTAKVSRYLRILQTECDREASLVDGLLELQRLESGVVTAEWSPVDVLAWLSDLVPVYTERAQSRQQTLQLQLPASLPTVCSDVSLLASVLRELLTNACKYTPPGGVLRVEASATETGVQVSVSNTGTAIPPEVLPRLFEKFYRAPGRDQWQQGGTGLGLALVKSQVERLGGTLSVSSDDIATVFCVTLPLSIAHSETADTLSVAAVYRADRCLKGGQK